MLRTFSRIVTKPNPFYSQIICSYFSRLTSTILCCWERWYPFFLSSSVCFFVFSCVCNNRKLKSIDQSLLEIVCRNIGFWVGDICWFSVSIIKYESIKNRFRRQLYRCHMRERFCAKRWQSSQFKKKHYIMPKKGQRRTFISSYCWCHCLQQWNRSMHLQLFEREISHW